MQMSLVLREVVVIYPAGSHTLLKILMNTFRGWGPALIYNTQQSIDLLPNNSHHCL